MPLRRRKAPATGRLLRNPSSTLPRQRLCCEASFEPMSAPPLGSGNDQLIALTLLQGQLRVRGQRVSQVLARLERRDYQYIAAVGQSQRAEDGFGRECVTGAELVDAPSGIVTTRAEGRPNSAIISDRTYSESAMTSRDQFRAFGTASVNQRTRSFGCVSG